jgi:hypothetical protein
MTSADACQHQAWQAQPLAVSPALVLHGLVEHALAGWGWLEQQVYPTQAASVSVMVGMHNKMVWAAPAGEVRCKCWGQASVIGRFNCFSCLMTRNTSHGRCLAQAAQGVSAAVVHGRSFLGCLPAACAVCYAK